MDIPSLTFGGVYKITQKIGGGSFGQIYLGIQTETNEEVAIKLEKKTSHQQLLQESRIYRILQGGQGIPNIL
jgi:Serine/threonine protein kinase